MDIPDALYRRVKARAALEGRAIRDVTIELYERWLAGDTQNATSGPEAAAWLERWKRMGDTIGERATEPTTTRGILVEDRR